jgi:mRNA interferase MazF
VVAASSSRSPAEIAPRRWGIYTVDLGQRIGSRPGKLRPCLAIQPSEFGEGLLPSTVVLPLTTRVIADAFPMRVHVPAGTAGLRAASDVMVDQLFACGNEWFRREVGELPEALRDDVREALREFLDL